jgi:hypothetical protein
MTPLRELQVNTHPNDVRHFPAIFAHMRRAWDGQVDAFRITLDTHNSVSGRYRSASFAENARAMDRFLADAAKDQAVIVDPVNDAPDTRRAIAQAFFGEEDVPAKAWDGGPFYSYLYGLWSSPARTLVHMDGDMMFGGGSKTWIAEAEARMAADPRCLFVAPLAGPPHPDGPQGANLLQPGHAPDVVEPARAYAYRSVSTRIFVTDTQRFRTEFLPLDHLAPTARERFKARLLGNPPLFREFERILSETMRARGFYRLDLLGQGEGMWSIHPPFRNPAFFAGLEGLIGRIERGDVPPEQRGLYDIGDSLCDWSDARAQNTRWRRLARQGQRMVMRHFA